MYTMPKTYHVVDVEPHGLTGTVIGDRHFVGRTPTRGVNSVAVFQMGAPALEERGQLLFHEIPSKTNNTKTAGS